MPMGKGFAISSDLNLRNILLSGYEKHTRRPDDDEEPSSKRRKLFALPKLKIAAITNDTVATLVSLAYRVKSLPNSRVAMGIIVGTGCNATIPMRLQDLHESKAKLVNSKYPEATETVVNTEWTIAGAAPPLKELNITTKWDTELDNACARPGFQPFEYMTGGRYIGELVRIVLFDYLTSVVGLSKKALPAALVQEYALTTTFLSQKVARSRTDHELAADLARSLPPPESSDWNWDASSAGAFRKIARAVQTRSAGLIAAAVVGLLACTREIQLKDDSAHNSPEPPRVDPFVDQGDVKSLAGSNNEASSNTLQGTPGESARVLRGLIVPVLSQVPADWQSGPEELVVAYTGGIIQNYPNFKEMCQKYIDRLIMRTGPQKGGKSVFLREASDGGVIGAGVLAGMVAGQ
jgi:hexokinase